MGFKVKVAGKGREGRFRIMEGVASEKVKEHIRKVLKGSGIERQQVIFY